MVAGWQSCHSGRWQLPCAPPRLAGMWVPLCRRPSSGSLMLPRGVRPVALQASDVVRKRQRRHCGGCFCAAFRYSARPVRWRAPAGILLLHLSCMLVARGVWPCRRGRLALQYGPFGPVIRAVSHGHTGRVSNLLCTRWLRNGAPPCAKHKKVYSHCGRAVSRRLAPAATALPKQARGTCASPRRRRRMTFIFMFHPYLGEG